MVELVTDALLVTTVLIAVEEFTVATKVKVALAPTLKEPMVQVGAFQVPVPGVALLNVRSDGILSVTTTFAAALGPLFVTVMV